jgi:hypothetical protein
MMPKSLEGSVCFLRSLILQRVRAARSSVYVTLLLPQRQRDIVYSQSPASICCWTSQLICVSAVILCHSVLCCHCRRDCTSIVLLGSLHCAANYCWSRYWIPCCGRRANDRIHSKSRRCQASIVGVKCFFPCIFVSDSNQIPRWS